MTDQTLCLCMIVKDEAPVIRRCLASVRPLITHWLVVDTGSTDNTQALVREALADLPGELVARPWVDFGHNRSEALALARPHAAYALIIDADDELLISDGFVLPRLDADSYVVDIADVGIRYQRTQLVANRLPWRYAGVLHEFLTCPEARSTGHLPLGMRRNHDGRRRRDPSTYRVDAAVLERALRTETDAFFVARYTFYLAQSYRDCGDKEAALAAYLRRADLGHWDQEIFVALSQAARLMEALGREPDAILATYARATAACPSRAEALHGSAKLCRTNQRYEEGYTLARQGLSLGLPEDGLFVEPWVYGYGLLDEFAVNASWTGRHGDSRDACRAMLANADLPAGDRARVEANLRFTEDRLAERWAAPDASWRPERPLGGTELMLDGLRARLGPELDRIDLNVTGYGKPDGRPLVVWIQHDIDQAAVQWFDDGSRAAQVDRFVFVSDWQRARYLERFGLLPERCTVIRNATDVPPLDRPWVPHRRPRLAYASTPYRGLAVLLDAWERLQPIEAELHVWSSHKLYGPAADDAAYEALYARARALPGVHYHGIAPNAALRELLRDCDLLAYPNTFAETSCITAIEAMAAGCRIVCPAHGVLPETTGGFARVYPFTSDPAAHCRRFADVLAGELRNLWEGHPERAIEQQRFARDTYDWPVILAQWRALIDDVTQMRPAAPVASAPVVTPPPQDRTVAALTRLRDRGFAPTAIVDAGAYRGDVARTLRGIFPDAYILMVDALAEQAPVLAEVGREIGNADHVIALLGERDAEATPFFVADAAARPDLVKTGSSKFRENTAFPMGERRIDQRRLETLLESGRSFGFVKLDLQGAELEALRGLGARLADVEAILTEISLVPYNAGAPLMPEVLAKLGTMGFALFDIVDELRDGGGSLLQVDGLFLRQDSHLRPQPPFWGEDASSAGSAQELSLAEPPNKVPQHEAAEPIATEPVPDAADHSLAAAVAHLAAGEHQAALQAASDACSAAPGRPEPHYAYGQAWTALGEHGRAEQAFAAALGIKPDWADAWVNWGVARYRQSAIEDAKTAMRQALLRQPEHSVAAANLGAFMRITGESDAAEVLLRAAVAANPADPGAKLNLAADLLQEERAADALAMLDGAPPSEAAAARHWHLQRALALLQLGRGPEARGALAAVAALGPVPPAITSLWHWRRVLLALDEGDQAAADAAARDMEAALEAHGAAMVPEHRLMARYDLAKFRSGRGEHARAFAHWAAAHRQLSMSQPFSRADHLATVEANIALFDRARFADGLRATNRDPAPVFIVGMPRSGTTLCERILAAHRDVHGAGERLALGRAFSMLGGGEGAEAVRRIAGLGTPALDAAAMDYLAALHALAPGKTRVVDKMPGNYMNLGLAGLMLPGAKIIWCRRDPRDIGLSIFTFRFHGQHGYAHDLGDLGWTIRQQERLMRHWSQVVPGAGLPVLAVDLADWVDDFDGTLARMLAHLDLPPDENCKRFHEVEARVRTVSRAQVREPVNARGLGRWRTYAAELAPLIAELER